MSSAVVTHKEIEEERLRDSLETVEACPICGERTRDLLYGDLTDRVFFCAPGAWNLWRCRGCRSAYLDPRLSPENIGLAYSRYYTHSQASGAETEAPQSRLGRLRRALSQDYLNARYGTVLQPASPLGRWILSLFPPRRLGLDHSVRHLRRPMGQARLLDLGCGNGSFLVQMRTLGWDICGLEPDTAAVAACREAGLPVQQGSLKANTFPAGSFDAVTLNHVVEHLHDPVEILRNCHRILRPGGVLWVATPNLASLGHRLFGRDWFHLDPPRHLLLFTPAALQNAAKYAGFRTARRHKPPFQAEMWFRPSAAIRRGEDPIDNPLLPADIARQARRADRLAWLRPTLAEEIILLAQKGRE